MGLDEVAGHCPWPQKAHQQPLRAIGLDRALIVVDKIRFSHQKYIICRICNVALIETFGRQAGAPRADRRELLDDAESVAYRRSGPIGDTLNMKKEGKELERSGKNSVIFGWVG
jgi:hypothetical protein